MRRIAITLTCLGFGVLLGAGALAGIDRASAPAQASGDPAATQVLVRLADKDDPELIARVREELGASSSSPLYGGWRVYRLRAAVNQDALEDRLSDEEGIQGAVIDRAVVRPNAIPNDHYWSHQWDMARIGAPAAWDHPTGVPVLVAVTDTGIDIGHPDLAPVIWRNTAEVVDGRDNDGNGYIDDIHGANVIERNGAVSAGSSADDHGTHVAGTIAAVRNNGIGVAGISLNARIMPVKFIGSGTGTHADAIESIRYAVRAGAKVINASWGTSTPDAGVAVCDAIAQAMAAGVVVVAAAGNEAVDLDQTQLMPAACPTPGLISVGSSDSSDGLSSFSNRGAGTVDLLAPGSGIASTIGRGGYGISSGTSMSAPHVAGAAALLLGRDPSLSPLRVNALIASSGDPIPAAAATRSGRRLNLAAALNSLLSPPQDTTAPQEFSLVSASLDGPRPLFRWRESWDAASGVAGYRLVIDDQVAATVSGLSLSARPLSDLPPGPHRWRIDAVDHSGNVRSSETRTLSTDQSPPSAFSVSAPRYVHRPDWSITWSAAIDLSGVDRYEVLIDGAVVAVSDELSPRRFTCQDPLGCLRPSAEGSVVSVRAVDGVGNARAVSSQIRRSEAPRAVLSGPAAQPSVAGVIHWQLLGEPGAVAGFELHLGDTLVRRLGPAERQAPLPVIAAGSHQMRLTTIATDQTTRESRLAVSIAPAGPAPTPTPPTAPDQAEEPSLLPTPARFLTPSRGGVITGPGRIVVRDAITRLTLRAPARAETIRIARHRNGLDAASDRPVPRLLDLTPGRWWIRFHAADAASEPRQVLIVRDQRAPRARPGALVRLTDAPAGVSRYQTRTAGVVSSWKAYRGLVRVSAGTQIRAIDRVGNRSAWIRVR
ncbi:S8 family peptidase [Miltoncostaea oceani]|uniref:S8 family peptidase n=1 Tax=Miltoncostaea oceani TaxID=2843216 RepID=UPI001C3C9083|nr:S8 family peptidase [Miltoncostaea oceani]